MAAVGVHVELTVRLGRGVEGIHCLTDQLGLTGGYRTVVPIVGARVWRLWQPRG